MWEFFSLYIFRRLNSINLFQRYIYEINLFLFKSIIFQKDKKGRIYWRINGFVEKVGIVLNVFLEWLICIFSCFF